MPMPGREKRQETNFTDEPLSISVHCAPQNRGQLAEGMAGVTGLEPAASGVTGQRSNQLSYTPAKGPTRGPP